MSYPTKFNRQSLPDNDNINPYAFCLAVNGELFIRKGKMIAHYGELRFEALGSGPYSTMVKKSFNAPEYANEFSIVTGMGKVLLGDNSRNITSFDLDKGFLTVRAANVLAFDKSLTCQECFVTGYLTLIGTGRFVASSNGPAHFMTPPVRVDEQALLGWADLPCPSYRYDYSAITTMLQALGNVAGLTDTGEERQVDFTGEGTVLIQSSEDQVMSGNALTEILGMLPGVGDAELQSLQQSIAMRLSNR